MLGTVLGARDAKEAKIESLPSRRLDSKRGEVNAEQVNNQICWCHELSVSPTPPNPFAEARSPSVMVFGDRAYKGLMKIK